MVGLGLNPHAGEGGLFGNGEEEAVIIPAFEEARARGFDITGPVPPDTAFLPDVRKRTDCFICMYHDQGHIPLKALAFDRAVNVTLGLPIVRTVSGSRHRLRYRMEGRGEPGELDRSLPTCGKAGRVCLELGGADLSRVSHTCLDRLQRQGSSGDF